MQIRKSVLSLAATCATTLLLAVPIGAMAQSKPTRECTLRTPHYFKEDHPWDKGLAYFAKKEVVPVV
jgi:TRAP-type C4-dicarboxylate transport system substrate-binding protein